MRDNLRDNAYWERIIEYETRVAHRCTDEVKSGSLPPVQHLATATNGSWHCLDVISCRYSAGLDGFREPLRQAVWLMDIGWDGSYLPVDHRKIKHHEYIQMYFDHVLWILSIAHLVKAEDEVFQTVAKVIDRDGVKDIVLEFLLSQRLVDRPVLKEDNYRYVSNPKLYGRLRQAITEPDPALAAEALKGYVRQDWYRAHSSAGWYNIHKSEMDLYSGYWCWEAAAVVKLRGLDDSGFRDWKYYPKDMLTGLE